MGLATIKIEGLQELYNKFEEVSKIVNSREVNKTLFDYEQIQKVVIRTEDFPRSPSMKIIRPRKAL